LIYKSDNIFNIYPALLKVWLTPLFINGAIAIPQQQ
jgi:hypothetical protein